MKTRIIKKTLADKRNLFFCQRKVLWWWVTMEKPLKLTDFDRFAIFDNLESARKFLYDPNKVTDTEVIQ